MGKLIKGKNLAKMIKDKTYGLAGTKQMIAEAFESKQVTGNDFSLQDLARYLIPDGNEYLEAIHPRNRGGFVSMEASQAVDTGAFAGITGQLIFSIILDAFQNAAFIGDQLCTTVNSAFQDAEIVPDIGKTSSSTDEIEEGQPYPSVGMTKTTITLPRAKKHGDILGITREMLIADRTDRLVERAKSLGEGHAHNREEEIVSIATGVTNNYVENGTALNTYQTATPWINQHANTLVDYTDINNAEKLLMEMTDRVTGRPIMILPDTILVPPALGPLARALVAPIMVNSGDITTGAGIQTSTSNNRLRFGYTVLESQYVKRLTTSDSTWFHGNPKAAFVWKEIWPLDVEQAPKNSEAEFVSDIVMRFKASYKGVAGVKEPRVMTKNT